MTAILAVALSSASPSLLLSSIFYRDMFIPGEHDAHIPRMESGAFALSRARLTSCDSSARISRTRMHARIHAHTCTHTRAKGFCIHARRSLCSFLRKRINFPAWGRAGSRGRSPPSLLPPRLTMSVNTRCVRRSEFDRERFMKRLGFPA
jgi:hypothetical protein